MAVYSTTDTIVAPATVPGRSAIAMLRLAGPRSVNILHSLSTQTRSTPPAAQARLFELSLGGSPARDEPVLIEQALVTIHRAPHSYTGDDLVEICIHGNPLLLERATQACLEQGARLAEPGEFTFRAFANGKLDLIQAEAVHDLINAGSSGALRLAQSALGGLPGRRVAQWQEQLLTLLSRIEMIHDYASDDLDASIDSADLLTAAQLSDLLAGIIAELDLARQHSRRNSAIRHGLSLAIVGPPNVGKSTLFNALLGFERALVHHSPGTTRDYLSESVEFGGISFTLVDTAGQRLSTDEIETAGVDQARDWQHSADLIIVVSAADSAPASQQMQTDDGDACRRLLVHTRCDLLPQWPAEEPGILHVSGTSGQGLDQLRESIIEFAGLRGASEQSGFNSRQSALIAQCQRYLQNAMDAIAAGMALDAAAQDIHLARESLLGVNESSNRQAVIDGIFSSFCVGK